MSIFKIPKNNARVDPEIVKRYDTSSKTWVDCEFAKRYDTASKTWVEIWTAATYFLKNGVLMNGAYLHYDGKRGNGYIYATSPELYSDVNMIWFQLTSDMVGKTLYVRAGSNVTAHSDGTGHSWLTIYRPMGEYGHGAQWCENRSGDLLTFSITSDYVMDGKYNYIGVTHTMSDYEYRIYDLFVA